MNAPKKLSDTCSVGDHLLFRLKELGIKHIFGVPGDFNLLFLDQIDAVEDLTWIGNCNELNAAYAADGYARIHGISALVTTFGVGELSAINGIAGAYAEQVPVITITGAPATTASEQGQYIHHTLGDRDFTHFSKMYKEVTVAQTSLTAENAQEEIDRVLSACWLHKRPVYIHLPSDVCHKEIQPPNTPLSLPTFTSDQNQLQEFLNLATETLEHAKSPVILADYEVHRYHSHDSLLEFVNKSGYPIASSCMGKGVINESHPQFIGIYAGKVSDPYVQNRIEGADCIISIGVKLTDVVTGGFTHNLDSEKIIELHPSYSQLGEILYEPIAMDDVLQRLSAQIKYRTKESVNILSLYDRQSQNKNMVAPVSSTLINQDRFWQRISEFLKQDDVIIADTGTAFFGAATVPLPEKATFIAQPLWASIGYGLPALLGTQIAAPTRRNILLIGDGAFQMTAQELSTIITHQLKPVIILINNDGYTIERLVHITDNTYNDIHTWKYHLLPNVFDNSDNCLSMRVIDEKQLEHALTQAETANQLIFIEVIMDRSDAPKLLNAMGKIFASRTQIN